MEEFPAPAHPGADGVHGQAHGLGDGPVGPLPEELQFQNGAVLLWQGPDQVHDPLDVPGLWGGGIPVRVQGQVPPLLFQEGVGGVLHNDDHPAQPPVRGDGEEGLRVLEAFHPGLLADLLPQDRAAGEGTGIAKQALLVGLKEQGEDAFFFGTLQGGQEQRQHMDFTPL